jgi:hypothetical protein
MKGRVRGSSNVLCSFAKSSVAVCNRIPAIITTYLLFYFAYTVCPSYLVYYIITPSPRMTSLRTLGDIA